jgi:hypothetical protein
MYLRPHVAESVEQPPNQRTGTDGDKISEMISISEASLCPVERIREGMSVRPKELSISGKILD